MGKAPSRLGYRMPAEWEEHEGTWISWPKDPDTFPGPILPKVEETYVSMVRALGSGETIHVLVDDAKARERVTELVGTGPDVVFHEIRTVDVWVRDYGPTYVKGRDVALVKWEFNAWGGKYDDLKPDNEAGEKLAASTGLTTFRPGLVLEGGSIDPNGKGSILTTEQCLLNPNRNPSLGKGELSAALEANLGASRVIWLGSGIEGDDTDGHVDDIARFVGPNVVMAGVEPDPSDRNHEPLSRNLALLSKARDQAGDPLGIVEIPMPRKLDSPDGRLPASHLNFYIGNGAVVVPTFGGSSDGVALRAIEGAFPGREVVGIDCRALVYGLGTLHCVTQQIPKSPT